MSRSHRINHQPVFLLASRPWRENSLRIEVFSREYGRLSLLARSARTRGSELRGVLVPFVPFSASWYGGEELKTLHRAEWLGGWPLPKNRALFSGLYANELVLRLTAREDPHPRLYDGLHELMAQIGSGGHHAAALRRFEWLLLQESGLAPDLDTDADGETVAADRYYLVRPESPLVPVDAAPAPPYGVVLRGEVLHQLRSGSLNNSDAVQQTLQLTRLLIDFRLPEGVKSRQILQQLNSYCRDMPPRVA